ncbi:trypsin-like peptidase domain-containing protein [Salisaeta longa]|uniref:trypsin-like peptidase domain-containing protein n=1 Tax=Salisaeta longa TaxID=503170 RepID=UPI0003B7ACA4|nr:trypsin-like peptidase domain-containing protein [Salisaeta longa]
MAYTLRRSTAALLGIGLLLVGLLSGILFMLITAPAPPAGPPTPQTNRVVLGAANDPVQPAADSAEAAPVTPHSPGINETFRSVAREATASVVYLEVVVDPPDGQAGRFQGDLQDFFRSPNPHQSVGSGVIISEDGHIVTNRHVVKNAETIRVTLADKREFQGTLVGTDPATDLAVLKIDAPRPLPALPIGASRKVQVGDWVMAVGNPFRLTSTVTTGIVSALGRQINIIDNSFRIEDFIQTDAAINPGNSGGALVNLSGELIGINTAIATDSGTSEGYGFAIPSALMERVARDLIRYGEVRRGYLGVSIAAVNDERAEAIDLGGIRGVYVTDVQPGSAAAQGGVQAGDVILAVNRRTVNATNELQGAVARHRPGDTIQLTVWRDGAERRLGVTLMGRSDAAYQQWRDRLQGPPNDAAPDDDAPMLPDAAPAPDSSAVTPIAAWGIGVRPLTAVERERFGTADGLYVAYVRDGGRAAAAGLNRDVVLTHVNRKAVNAAAQLAQRIEAAQPPMLVRVRRSDGTTAFYELL